MKRKSQKTRFSAFVRDLERISSMHGIAVQSVGGVYIFDDPIKISYSKDHTSGDLLPSWEESDELRRGEGYAIFTKDVAAKDRYKVQSKPKVYTTRKEAEKALRVALKKGWKKSDLKILKY